MSSASIDEKDNNASFGPYSQDLIDSLPFYVLLVDEDHRIVMANQSVQTSLGKDPSKIIGKYCPHVIHNMNTPFPGCPLEEAVEKDRNVERELYDPKYDRWVNSAIYLIPNVLHKGKKVYFHMVVDITERKKAKEELELHARLLDSATDSIFVHDFEGNFTYLNEAAYKSHGYSKDELMRINLKNLDVPEYAKLIKPQIKELMEKGKTTFESAHFRKDKSIMPVEVHARTIETGGRKLVLSVVRDITGHKKAEETLRESEENLRSYLEYAPDAIYITDLKGTLLYGNKKAENITGYKRKELIGSSLLKLKILPAKYMAKAAKLLALSALGKSTGPDEFELTKKGGKRIQVEITTTPIKQRGKVVVIGFVRDITERIKVEVALRNSEASLTKAQRIAHLGNWDWDIVNNNLSWTDEIYRIFGIKPQQFEANYEAFLKKVHPADRELVQQSVNKALNNGKAYNIDHRIILPNGSERIVNEQAEVTFGVKGDPIRMVGTIQDITERKKAEHDLGERFKELMCLYGISQSIIKPGIDIDKLLLETANLIPSGWQYPDITCARITFEDKEFKTGNFKETKWKQTSDILVKGEKHGSVEVCYLEEKPQIDEGPFLKEEGNLIDGISRMLSEALGRHKAEEDREELQTQLQQSQKMEAVGRLAGGIAHDFNNLLTVIMGYSQMLLEDIKKDDPKYQEIEEISKAGKRAALLTRQMLTFSRKQEIFPRVININEAVMNMGKMLKRVIGEDIELKTELGKDLDNVKADPGQIEQVVMNLAINARDAMPDGGKLYIRTQMADIDKLYAELHPEAKSGRYNCITIEDTGRGMDKDTLKHAFEPFFTTKEAGKGTGLGLSVVFGIIKQHGGWINVYSEVGKGTAFKIYLPSVLEGVDKERDEEVKLSELKGNGETILLVEDEDGVREFAKRVLTNNGYAVIAATTAKEGLEVFERERDNIDLVFCDIVLPDMNGIKLVKEMSSHVSKLNYILCSGYTQNNHNVITELQEESRYIQKPYSITDLLKIVKRALS